MQRFFAIFLLVLGGTASSIGCIWDSDTLKSEKRKSPDLAAVILGTRRETPDTNALIKRIQILKAKSRDTAADWYNELAGAYLRLGQAQEAVKLLEPVIAKFPDDYGIHANLGTAYHLLGRYQEAEREIARDLELKPDAHFGLEVYHLALLQYLSRDKEYQAHHVYVDEFTEAFLRIEDLGPFRSLASVSRAVDPPYRSKWNLAANANFEKGVRYMAELNEREPACFVMLGMACLQKGDLNLASAAFERAVDLGSPQRELLEARITHIADHIREARAHSRANSAPIVIFVALGLATGLFLIFAYIRQQRAVRDPYGDAKEPGSAH